MYLLWKHAAAILLIIFLLVHFESGGLFGPGRVNEKDLTRGSTSSKHLPSPPELPTEAVTIAREDDELSIIVTTADEDSPKVAVCTAALYGNPTNYEYLNEWIRYQRYWGFSIFSYYHPNRTNPRFVKWMKKNMDVVETVPFCDPIETCAHLSSIHLCHNKTRQNFDWVIMHDIDESLHIPGVYNREQLYQFLEAHSNVAVFTYGIYIYQPEICLPRRSDAVGQKMPNIKAMPFRYRKRYCCRNQTGGFKLGPGRMASRFTGYDTQECLFGCGKRKLLILPKFIALGEIRAHNVIPHAIFGNMVYHDAPIDLINSHEYRGILIRTPDKMCSHITEELIDPKLKELYIKDPFDVDTLKTRSSKLQATPT
eukprot:jgi/Bigna1/141150/aug1.60_g15858